MTIDHHARPPSNGSIVPTGGEIVGIYLLDTSGKVVTGGNTNNLGGDPVEVFGVTNGGGSAVSLDIMILNFAGPNPGLIKYVAFGGPDPP